MTANLIRSTVACRAIGVDHKTFSRWVHAGIVSVTSQGKSRGKGSRWRLKFEDVLFLAVSRHLKSKGFDRDSAFSVAAFVRERSLDDLKKDWSQGKTLLLSVGTRTMPFLMNRASIFENQHIDIPAALEAKIPVAVVDLKAAHDQLLLKLEESDLKGVRRA